MKNNSLYAEECDSWFNRNKESFDENNCPKETYIIEEFIERTKKEISFNNVLEIGCSYGYSLQYLHNLFGLRCCGIDLSEKAINFGRQKYPSLELEVAGADNIPYGDNSFELVIAGFFLYMTDRRKIVSTLSEIDRVLTKGGVVAVSDFDTIHPYIRENKHNKDVFTYKKDYAELFKPFGYTLIEKRSHAYDTDCFVREMQKRSSTQILYKERSEDYYIVG